MKRCKQCEEQTIGIPFALNFRSLNAPRTPTRQHALQLGFRRQLKLQNQSQELFVIDDPRPRKCTVEENEFTRNFVEQFFCGGWSLNK